MNENKPAHPPILRGYEKEVCNECLGTIHKRRLLRGGVKNRGFYLVKSRLSGSEEGHKIQKMSRRRLWMAPYKYSLSHTYFLNAKLLGISNMYVV